MSDRSTAPLAILVVVADASGMVSLRPSDLSENRARAIEHIVREDGAHSLAPRHTEGNGRTEVDTDG